MNWKKFSLFALSCFLAFFIVALSVNVLGAIDREKPLHRQNVIISPKQNPSVSAVTTSTFDNVNDVVEVKAPPLKTGISPLERSSLASAEVGALSAKEEDEFPPERIVTFPLVKQSKTSAVITPKITQMGPSEVWVDDDFDPSTPGWGYDHFDKIQDGVNAVASGGTVNVADGNYIENILVSKSCNIIGSGYSGSTVVDANSAGNGFSISADSVLLKGFKIINARGNNVCGIFIGGTMPGIGSGVKQVTVRENEVTASNFGIYLWHSDSNLVVKNLVHHCPDDMAGYGGVGIILWDGNSYNTIDSNEVYTNDRFGVFLGYSDDSKFTDHNTIAYNKIYNNGQNTTVDGSGLMLQNADYNTISWNRIYDNTDATHDFQLGIYLQGSCDHNQVLNNEVKRNKTGIGLYVNCTYNSIIGNKIACNDLGVYKRGIGIFDVGSSNNTLYQNFLFLNPINARDNGSNNTWDNGVNTGNFWDDWASNSGYPTQYNVPGAALSVDHYPQASPSVVWVDDDWAGVACGDSVGGHLFGYDAFAIIKDGIVGVAPGGTVNVATGTYSESDTINKSVTLTGDPGDATPGPGPSAPILDGTGFSGVPAFSLATGVSNVTIQGFEIRNYGPDGNTNADGVVAWNSGTSNVIIRDNYFHHLGYAGVLVGNGWGGPQGVHTGWVVTNNIIKYFGAYALDMENTQNTQLTNNQISDPTFSSLQGIMILALADPGNSITSSNITISGNNLNISDRTICLVQWAQDAAASATLQNVTIRENTITTNFYAISPWKLGPGTNTIKNLTINSNIITVNNPKGAGYAVDLFDVAGTSTFDSNTVTLTGVIGGGGTFFHGINVGGAATGTWTFNSNQVDGNNVGSASCGYRLRGTLPATAVLNVTGNTITEFANGIRSDALAGGTTVDVHYSKIEGNSAYGVTNGAGVLIDAEDNWWGSYCGPYHPTTNPKGQGNAVSNNVDYEPWCDSTFTKCDFSTAPPLTVWVDDNYTPSGYNDGHYWCYDAFAKIEDGVTAVATGGTVNVASGTYNVIQVLIDRAVKLLGAGAATTIIDGGKSDLNPLGRDGMIYITGSSTGWVLMDGFTLQNPGYIGTPPDDWVLALVFNASSESLTVQNCHFIGYGPSDPDHWDYGIVAGYYNQGPITIKNNEFELMWAAILIELPDSPVRVLNNNIHHLQSQIYPPEPPPIGPVYSAYGFFATTYGGHDVTHLQQVNGNTFSDYAGRSIHYVGGYPGVSGVNKWTNVEIKDNKIYAIGTGPEHHHAGIILANAGTTPAEAATGGVDNAIISGNKMKGTGGTDSYGIRLRGPNNDCTIQNNTIKGINKGIAVEEWYTGAGAATGLTAYENILMCNTTNAQDNGSSNAWDNGSVGNFWDDWSLNSGYPTQYNVPGTAGSVDHFPQAPMVVWVDDDWAGTACGDSVGGHLFGYDAFAHVQDGVNGVAVGGTVNAYPGTYGSRYFECPWSPNCSCSDNYSPALIVYKDGITVHALDPNPANTVIQSTHTCWSNAIAVENSTRRGVTGINGWAPNAAVVVAKNTTIEGFTFRRPYNCVPNIYDCFYNTAGVMIGAKGAGYDDYLGKANGNIVRNNVFEHVWHGVYIWRSSYNQILSNTVKALTDSTQHWAGMSVYDGGVDVTGDTLKQSRYNQFKGNRLFDKGIAIGAWPGMTVNSGTTIQDDTCNSIGITYSKNNNVVVQRNNVSGSTGSGIWTYACAMTNTQITANSVTSCVTGLRLDSLDINSAVTNNSITGNSKGIRVLTGTVGSIFNNDLSGNSVLGVENLTASVVNSSGNWWGDNTPTGVASEVSANVDYTPWLDIGTDISGDPGFQGDFSTLWVDDNSPQTGSTGRIQEGVNLVSGSTVNVVAGTYTEHFVIDKSLNLLGAGEDSVLVYPDSSDIGIPDPELGPSFRGSQMCVVQASDVTIDGFTFDGDSPTLTPPGTLDARNGIITNYYAGNWSNLKVQNCTVKNIYLRGIYSCAKDANTPTGISFYHNTVTNVKGVSMQSAAIMLWGCAGEVKKNNISDASIGVMYHIYSDGAVDSNTISNCEVAIAVNSNDDTTTVSKNTITDSDQGIQTISTLHSMDVANNGLTNCYWGMVAYGGGDSPANFLFNKVQGPSSFEAIGFYASTDISPWGMGDVYATLKNNTITKSFWGVVLSEPSTNTSKLISMTIGGSYADHNFIYDNINYEVLMDHCNDNVNARYNYWGKSSLPAIEADIYHKVDESKLGLVDFGHPIILGDVDQDGDIDLADVIYLANYILSGGATPPLMIVCDVNHDGKYSLADVVYLANYILSGGPPPLIAKSVTSEQAKTLKLVKPEVVNSLIQ